LGHGQVGRRKGGFAAPLFFVAALRGFLILSLNTYRSLGSKKNIFSHFAPLAAFSGPILISGDFIALFRDRKGL
jgi:hypothetical protein